MGFELGGDSLCGGSSSAMQQLENLQVDQGEKNLGATERVEELVQDFYLRHPSLSVSAQATSTLQNAAVNAPFQRAAQCIQNFLS